MDTGSDVFSFDASQDLSLGIIKTYLCLGDLGTFQVLGTSLAVLSDLYISVVTASCLLRNLNETPQRMFVFNSGCHNLDLDPVQWLPEGGSIAKLNRRAIAMVFWLPWCFEPP